jgi:hypothetical protein
MDNPTTEVQVPENSEAGPVTFEQHVNAVVKQLKQDDSGTWQLPDTVEASEEVKYAAMLEKRRRDTESALGKTRQQLKAQESMTKELEQRVAAQVKIDMTPEEADALEYLKDTDADAWRRKMNALEQQATTKLREELDGISLTASQQAELERRAQVLNEFNQEHADFPITDELLANDIPPRIVKKLETGKISFEDFLAEAYNYVKTPKKVASPKLEAQPNLGNAGGGANPSHTSQALGELESYRTTTF